jgi:hypothetical protein
MHEVPVDCGNMIILYHFGLGLEIVKTQTRKFWTLNFAKGLGLVLGLECIGLGLGLVVELTTTLVPGELVQLIQLYYSVSYSVILQSPIQSLL